MMRQVLYVAHPVAPTEEEARDAADVIPGDATDRERSHTLARPVRANIDRALRWLAWLRKSFPETTFIAPWIASIMAGADDSDPAQREAGLVDCCAVIERCDGIVLVGGRISSGMRREMEHGLATGLDDSCEPHLQEFKVYDLTCPRNPETPLTVGRQFITLEELAEIARGLWRK